MTTAVRPRPPTMPRPSNEDLDVVRQLREQLEVVKLGEPSFRESWLPLLRDALELDTTCIYGVRNVGGGHRLSFCNTFASPRGAECFASGLDQVVQHTQGRWGMYNPDRPEPRQRNKPLIFPPSDAFLQFLHRSADEAVALYRLESREDALRACEGFAHLAEFLRAVGLERTWQLRMLACDDHTLLGWVGGFRFEEPSHRELYRLGAILPSLQRRFTAERLLERTPLLQAALEQLPRAAFLIDAHGQVQCTNALGRARLDAHRTELAGELQDAVSAPERSQRFNLIALKGQGLPSHFLALARGATAHGAQVQLQARRWGLTPRQAQVLAELAEGHPTRVIAARLDCAERTIEAHVTAILIKADVESRSELLAKLLHADG